MKDNRLAETPAWDRVERDQLRKLLGVTDDNVLAGRSAPFVIASRTSTTELASTQITNKESPCGSESAGLRTRATTRNQSDS